jgi:hypothetical protein
MESPLLILLLIACCLRLSAQDKTLPYYEIPPAPENFTAGGVAARMIDGLGFRYYWATEGLRAEDLAWKPGKEARTSEETLSHIYDMSIMIINATTNSANTPQTDRPKLPFSDMRKRTLENLKTASDQLRGSTDAEMKAHKLIFKRDANATEYPFWNLINGPIADCLWHVGQVVSFRRSSGNPFADKANVFTGKVKQ